MKLQQKHLAVSGQPRTMLMRVPVFVVQGEDSAGADWSPGTSGLHNIDKQLGNFTNNNNNNIQ